MSPQVRRSEETIRASPQIQEEQSLDLTKQQHSQQMDMLQFEPVQPKNKSIVYKKYMNFLNFKEFNKTNPIYVSMVRDPMERVISWYYYHRQTTYLLKFEDHFPPKYYKESYEDCVAAQREPCQFIENTPIFSEMGKNQLEVPFVTIFYAS